MILKDGESIGSIIGASIRRGKRNVFRLRPVYNAGMNYDADIGIVGAGPLGIELAVALKRAGFSIAHFDARQIGGTIAWWAPGTRWFSSPDRISIAGIPLLTPNQEKATREEYLAYLRSVVLTFDLAINTYERVVGIERMEEGFTLHTERAAGGRAVTVRKLVLATGGTERARKLGIPGEELPHVSHYFRDPHDYFQKRLLVVGGRNSAIEAALRTQRAGAKVSLAYRRANLDARDIKYWLYPEITGLLKSDAIRGYFSAQPTAIRPSHVTLANADGSTVDVPADFVLLMTGYVADMGLCKMAGIALEGDQQLPRYNPATMETNVPGLYIAGTAVAGTQERYRIFLENCHAHVHAIAAALSGKPMAAEEAVCFAQPES
jgi:thioredoxin reductase (NADPH)